MNPVEKIKIRAVGDNLIHNQLYVAAKKSADEYDFSYMYEHIKDVISEADIKVINQETILVKDNEKVSSFPSFGTPKDMTNAIEKAGFNVVTHASNHAYDKGLEGIDDTISLWKEKKDILMLGLNENKEKAQEIDVIEIKGVKFALLNYTATLNYKTLPLGRGYAVNLMKPHTKTRIKKQLQKAKAISDFIIVFPHWGCEYLSEPVNSQKKWAQFFADCGADLIIGSHPHVLQSVEIITSKSGNIVPCYYSLGNFISCQTKAFTPLGGMADVEIIKDNDGIRVSQSSIIPIVTHRLSCEGKANRKFYVYTLDDYTEELASENWMFSEISKNYNIQANKAFYEKLFNDVLNHKSYEYNEFKSVKDVKLFNIKAVYRSKIKPKKKGKKNDVK